MPQNYRNTPNLYYLAAASSSSCENDGSDGSYFGRNNLHHARHFPTHSTAGVVGFLAGTTSANSPYTSAQSVCDTLLSTSPETSYHKRHHSYTTSAHFRLFATAFPFNFQTVSKTALMVLIESNKSSDSVRLDYSGTGPRVYMIGYL